MLHGLWRPERGLSDTSVAGAVPTLPNSGAGVCVAGSTRYWARWGCCAAQHACLGQAVGWGAGLLACGIRERRPCARGAAIWRVGAAEQAPMFIWAPRLNTMTRVHFVRTHRLPRAVGGCRRLLERTTMEPSESAGRAGDGIRNARLRSGGSPWYWRMARVPHSAR